MSSAAVMPSGNTPVPGRLKTPAFDGPDDDGAEDAGADDSVGAEAGVGSGSEDPQAPNRSVAAATTGSTWGARFTLASVPYVSISWHFSW